MNDNPKREWIYKVLAIVKFIVGIAAFFSTWIIYNFPIHFSIIISISIVLLLFLVSEIASKFSLHSRYAAPLRKWFLYLLSSVVIEKWNVTLIMEDEGDVLSAHVINEFQGKVNFGFAKWMTIGIWTGKKQLKGKTFKIRIFNVNKQSTQKPEFLFNEERYKKIRINFRHTLKNRERFHFKVEYNLKKTFYYDNVDYYDFHSVHHEKEINMKVIFPENIQVDHVGEEITTEHGDKWEEHEKARPTDPQTIEWKIHRALDRNHHKLIWKAIKK